MNIEESVESIEAILKYKFKDRSLLEEALTHPSYTGRPSYQRLEFLGDSVLGLAISGFFFSTYPYVDDGSLTLLRAANVSKEKLARVAVRHGLYNYIRHNYDDVLTDKVREFLIVVEEEEEMVVHGGLMKPPKVLVDIVESVIGAVYVDCGFNLEMSWMIFRHLLEPLVMLDFILDQPQPISELYMTCGKDSKRVDIRYQCNEIEGAKQKVHELCNKKKWPKPTYRVEQESGPAHDKRYISSVQVELPDKVLYAKGNERFRVKDAENSAAAMMFRVLLKY